MAGKDEHRIFVGGLSWNVTERQLENAFARFGKVTEAQVLFFFFFFEFSPCLVPENSVRNRKLSSKFKTYLYFFTLIYTHIGFLASLLIINWDLNLSCFLVRRKRNLPFHFLFSSSSSSSFFKIYLHFSYIGFFCFLGTLYFFSFRYCMKCIYIGYKCLWGFKLHIVD